MALTPAEATGVALGTLVVFLVCTMILCCFVRAPKTGFCGRWYKPEAPRVYFAENQRNKFLLDRTPCLFTRQNPVLALYHRWISTLWVSVRGAFHKLPPSKNVVIPAFDGGEVELEVIHPETAWSGVRQPLNHDNEKKKLLGGQYARQRPNLKKPPVLILCPSIGAELNDPCVADTMRSAYEDGWICVAIIHHGAGKVKLSTKHLQTWGETRFLEDTMTWVKEKYDGHPILAAGFSMGANWLTKYMGTVNEDPNSNLFHFVSGAITVSNCLRVDGPGYGAYQHIRDSPLVHFGAWKHATNPIKKAPDHIQNCDEFNRMIATNDIEGFDRIYMLDVLGYETWEAALEGISGVTTVSRITKPFFALGSIDDPFVYPTSPALDLYGTLPTKYENVICATTNYGGHIGWYEDMFFMDGTTSRKFRSLGQTIISEMGAAMLELENTRTEKVRSVLVSAAV